jgi:hypothetical protein
MDAWRGVRFGMDIIGVERALLATDPSLVFETHPLTGGTDLMITGDGWKAGVLADDQDCIYGHIGVWYPAMGLARSTQLLAQRLAHRFARVTIK